MSAIIEDSGAIVPFLKDLFSVILVKLGGQSSLNNRFRNEIFKISQKLPFISPITRGGGVPGLAPTSAAEIETRLAVYRLIRTLSRHRGCRLLSGAVVAQAPASSPGREYRGCSEAGDTDLQVVW